MTAKPERKQRVKALLIPVTLTAMLCGITEPLDFTFLFIAPGLFVVHCVLGALGCMAQNLLGVVGIFDGGIISMLSWDWLPLWAAHGLQYAISILVGLCFTALWVVVFRFLIVKFDFKTPAVARMTMLRSSSSPRPTTSKSRAVLLLANRSLRVKMTSAWCLPRTSSICSVARITSSM